MVFLSLLLLCGLCLWLYLQWRSTPVAIYFWPALVLKIVAGWGMIALYRYYYGYGDVLHYHQKAARLVFLFGREPALYLAELGKIGILSGAAGFHGSDRVDFFIRLISPFYILSDGNVWIVSAWLSAISFFGLFWLSRRFSEYVKGSGMAAAVAFLFWPSLIFFTGSITKEALVMPSIAVLVAVFLPDILGKGNSSISSSRLLEWALALLAAWIIWRIKYYFALPLFAILAALLLASFTERKQMPQLRLWLLLAGAFIAVGFLLSQMHPNLNPERVLEVISDNYREKSLIGEDYKRLHFDALQPSLWSILLYTPKALAGGLLMPLPLFPFRLEVLPLIAGVENLLFLVLIIGAYYKLYRLPYQRIPLAVLGLVLYVGLLAVLMAIASPNLGTLMRYRTAYLPFAVFLVLYWLFPASPRPKQ